MAYLGMAVSILLATISSCALHKFGNRTFRTPGDVFFFNAAISAVWLAILLVWFCAAPGQFSGAVLAFGAVYGAILCLFLHFKMQAMASGPVSLTTLIGSSAFLIATAFGVLYCREPISASQLVGSARSLGALVLCVNPRRSGEALTLRWFGYCAAFFAAGGAVGILYKVFGRSSVADQTNAMMLTAAAVSAAVFAVFGCVANRRARAPMPAVARSAWPYVLAAGITSCVYIRLNLSLSAQIPSAIFFPVSNGAMVILSTAAGRLIFREKLTRTQWAGILLGVLAIAVTGCGDAAYAWIRSV